jgi:hypothetical protein
MGGELPTGQYFEYKNVPGVDPRPECGICQKPVSSDFRIEI